jgi:nitroimidazol reductase NimA-like FMN-containing flavoprotein (pyridoxamine 5'-phosphate oxidase superfamily)
VICSKCNVHEMQTMISERHLSVLAINNNLYTLCITYGVTSNCNLIIHMHAVKRHRIKLFLSTCTHIAFTIVETHSDKSTVTIMWVHASFLNDRSVDINKPWKRNSHIQSHWHLLQ